MAQTEKIYEVVTDAEEIIRKLKEKYEDELWAVRPDIITVLGVSNKDRPKNSTKLACVIPVKGCTKALMQLNRVNTRYIIELYWSDWHKWNKAQKEAIMFHELLHIDHEIGKVVKHDVEDFKLMVDKMGYDWFDDPKLPSLLENKIVFNKSLRPNVPEDGQLEIDSGDEILEEPDQEQNDDSEGNESDEVDELF